MFLHKSILIHEVRVQNPDPVFGEAGSTATSATTTIPAIVMPMVSQQCSFCRSAI
jgi:hypothetical protein